MTHRIITSLLVLGFLIQAIQLNTLSRNYKELGQFTTTLAELFLQSQGVTLPGGTR